MLDENTRINAVITYLFLGPIMLFAKAGTPLWDAYVQSHARRASVIQLMGFVFLGLYFFIKKYLTFGVFWISLSTIVLMVIMSVFLLVLLAWAYAAYRGKAGTDISWKSLVMMSSTFESQVYDDEQKIRIIASFLPFIGMIVAEKFPMKETAIGRKMWNWITFLIIVSSVFISWNVSMLALILTIGYIWLIVTTAVYLFVHSRFINFWWYQFFPTYLQFDAHIKALCMTWLDFVRVSFGKKKSKSYQERYQAYLHSNQSTMMPKSPYFAPLWLVCIPVINLLLVPSLFTKKSHEYGALIVQWFFLTVLFGVVIWKFGIHSQAWLFLLFPIITLAMYAQKNVLVRAPITSIMVDLYDSFYRSKKTIDHLQKQKEHITFSYTDKNIDKK